jgi:DNA-binding response OmpR family regulator
MEAPNNVLIVSGDDVFNELMATLLHQFSRDTRPTKIRSYNDLRIHPNLERTELILLGDVLEGAGGTEPLIYLREKRNLLCPICYFCDDAEGLKEKVLHQGANYCYTKPLKPDRVILNILEEFSKSRRA